MQIRRTIYDHGVSDHEAGGDFGVRTTSAAQSDCAALEAIIFHEKYDLFSAVVVDGALRDERQRHGGLRARFFLALVTKEGDLDAHVGKNSRVELVKRDADF